MAKNKLSASQQRSKEHVIGTIQRSIKSQGYCDVFRGMGARVFISDDEVQRAASEGKSTAKYRFRITDESIDDHYTVFKTDKWRMENYNGVVTAQHPYLGDTDTKLFIGTSTLERVGDAYYADLKLQQGPANTTARDVEEKLDQEIFKGASIYARVYDGSYGVEADGEDPEVFYFRDQELVTWGVVAFNSNANAVRVMTDKKEEEGDPPPPPPDPNQDEEQKKKDEADMRMMQVAGDKLRMLNTRVNIISR